LGTARLTNDPVPPAPLPESVQPAAVKPTPTPKPQLASDSFLEEEYRIRAGDSFELLSRRFYYSEKYGEALRQYNRDYPIASANLRQDPPRLTPGTVVWIPPMRVLERRYAALLPDVKPVTPAQASNPAPTGNGPTWTPSNPRPNSSATKTYRVKEGGETLAEIARKTLGRSEYWGEIFQRNPQLTQNATTPIAPGTLLTLPGEAKID
jgi:nucleoid-associated protein YgaU